MDIQLFSDEQARVASNLATAYLSWRDAKRKLLELGPSLVWKSRDGRDYLYSSNGSGAGTSLGPRSPQTESRFQDFRSRRDTLATTHRDSGESLAVQARLYRATRMLAIGSQAAAILRELDESRMLDESLVVVGTSTMAAYELEAAARFATGMDATEDFDLAWAGRPTQLTIAGGRKADATLFAALKRLDPTFTINTERNFQARNSKAYEVDLLVAPSQAGNISRDEKLQPLPLPEQEWLLMGRRVDQVVGALDGTAARIVAPDPRWMMPRSCSPVSKSMVLLGPISRS